MLEAQLSQLNKKFEHLSKRVDAHDLRFDSLDEKIDLLAQTVVRHDQRLANIEENMVTKKEFRELINIMDYSVKEVMNMKEDHVFGTEWMKRMQEQLGWHELDIKKLKLMLNLA